MVNCQATTISNKMEDVLSPPRTVMPKDKFNWVKTNAMVAQPAQLDKFLEPTTDVLLHYQHAHVIKLSTLSLEHAKTAQQDNSVLMEEHANQFHQTVTKMVNSN
jgi:hypothetical protein